MLISHPSWFSCSVKPLQINQQNISGHAAGSAAWLSGCLSGRRRNSGACCYSPFPREHVPPVAHFRGGAVPASMLPSLRHPILPSNGRHIFAQQLQLKDDCQSSSYETLDISHGSQIFMVFFYSADWLTLTVSTLQACPSSASILAAYKIFMQPFAACSVPVSLLSEAELTDMRTVWQQKLQSCVLMQLPWMKCSITCETVAGRIVL